MFCQAVQVMQNGKAVGEGGFSVELLKRAGEGVLEMFYDAKMADIKRETIPAAWKKVLYVLLSKPPPNDPALIGGRREITLMAQDMKLCLQMVRRAAYAKVAQRLESSQVGWAVGYGTGDVGLELQCAIQQAKRVSHPLYILYLDLATFFPKISREVIGTIGELLVGLPTEVKRLVLMIYGGYDGKGSDCVECQYDTAAGLSSPFKNWMGPAIIESFFINF